ncbi:MAG: hypothetical protein R3338_08640 [Thermoanaerobaculia bacterium]|nr:hypothetical protein [Thermoanaerobaculia bacterium]
MQTQYTPPSNQETPAKLYTTAGWIDGSFLIPPKRSLTDFANQNHDFFKLKNVKLPGLENQIEFFALQRHSVVLMIPDVPQEGVDSSLAGVREHKDVSCAFDNGVVSGDLTVGKGIRMSDFMLKRQMFFYLKDCTLFLRTAGKAEVTKNVPLIIINREKIIGVSEPRFV